jgi:RHS repeat-associated protein
MLSRLMSAANPESGTTCFYYTTSGGTCGVASSGTLCSGDMSAVCRRTDARGKTTTYAYDGLNRLITKSYSDTTPGVAYGYDAVAPSGCTPPSLAITYGKGRRTSMCDGPGATSWSFDQVGNALTEERTTNSVTDSFTYAYNLDSTVATIGYPSGRTITYQPGGAQRPQGGKDITNSINYATGAHYFPPGELGSLTNGSSINFTTITNDRLQPCWIYATTGTALSWSNTSCTTPETTAGNILDLEYGLNFGSSDNGNVMGITNNRDSTRSQTFTYDYLNRMATGAASTYAASPSHCWGETYKIDRYGNLSIIGSISSAYNGCTQDNLNISVSSSTNQITTGGFTYDASGDLTSDGTHSPTYDAEGRMISDAGVTYYYDADGKRVQKSSGTLYWYGTSPDPLLETNASGGLVNEYIFFGGKRISRRDSSSNIEYYFADRIGSSRVVTNASGTILADCDYFPYGGTACSPSSTNNYLFTGKERDSESGLDNFGARYDSSQYGRFMTPDPGNAGAVSTNPQSWNMYSYVMNNPLRFTDPADKSWEQWERGDNEDYALDGSDTMASVAARAQVMGDDVFETMSNFAAAVSNQVLNLGGTNVDSSVSAAQDANGRKGADTFLTPSGCDECRWVQTDSRTGEGEHPERADPGYAGDPLYPQLPPGYPGNILADSPRSRETGTFTAVSTLGIADVKAHTFTIKGSVTWGYSVDRSGTVSATGPEISTVTEQNRSLAALRTQYLEWSIK